MRIFESGKMQPGTHLGPNMDEWIYNGLDSTITYEVFNVIKEKLDPISQKVYETSLRHMAPALDMMLRGIKIDVVERANVLAILRNRHARLESIFARYAEALGCTGVNYRSRVDLRRLIVDKLQIPPVVKSFKGNRRETFNREAMEKFEDYYSAKPLVKVILGLRDIDKLISVLLTKVDSDGRMRTSYNIGGTNTFRWSSSENAFEAGTNLQNITDRLRKIFIADPGKKLAYIDLEQAESRAVGLYAYHATGISKYLDACESGDLHTTVTKMVWPSLFVPGANESPRDIADRPYYREFSYRDMSKRLGHGTNYGGSDHTLANVLKIERKIVTEFQLSYNRAFVELQRWHGWVARELITKGYLITPTGHRRHFFGRHDENTIRKAIAYGPQSLIGVLLNEGMFRVWKHFPQVELLAQIHDAILIQYDEHLEDEIIPKVLEALRIPVTLNSPSGEPRTIIIPTEASVGWNWSKFNSKDPQSNPNGLMKWKGRDARRRHFSSDMDRLVSSSNERNTSP